MFHIYATSPPPNETILEYQVLTSQDTLIKISSPGDWQGAEVKNIRLKHGAEFNMNVMHEIFEVLDFDGQQCGHYQYPYGRDGCIENVIHQESLARVGCTSPFGFDKSNICQDPDKAAEVMRLKRNLSSEIHKICPRSCQYLMTTFDSYDSVPFAEGPGVLKIHQGT